MKNKNYIPTYKYGKCRYCGGEIILHIVGGWGCVGGYRCAKCHRVQPKG